MSKEEVKVTDSKESPKKTKNTKEETLEEASEITKDNSAKENEEASEKNAKIEHSTTDETVVDSSKTGETEKPEMGAKEAEKAAKKAAAKPVHDKKIVLTPKKYQHGKKYRKVESEIEKGKEYPLDEAISLVKKTSTSKFDGSIEIHVNLNIDPSNADHQIRGSVLMPAGLGKNKKVCAVVSADKEKEAKEAGAETVGGMEVIEKIEKGWTSFDVLVATPDMMASLGKLGKVLGTKGLMPNPKTGTVTPEPGKVIADIKKGRAEYKIDKAGTLHSSVGKVSFKDDQLKENIETYLDIIHHSKPESVKGTFIKSVYLTSTMGPSVKITK